MSSSRPEIDLTRVPFPSDRIALGDLRRRHPDLFDESEATAGMFFDGSGPLTDLWELVAAERRVAAALFETTLHPDDTRLHPFRPEDAAARDDLMLAWQRFGLAAGPAEAGELLRRLAAACAAQAQQHLPGDRGVG